MSARHSAAARRVGLALALFGFGVLALFASRPGGSTPTALAAAAPRALGAPSSRRGASAPLERGPAVPPGVSSARALPGGGSELVLVEGAPKNTRVDFELRLDPARPKPRPVILRLSPEDPARLEAPGLGRVELVRARDPKSKRKELDGRVLRVVDFVYVEPEAKWRSTNLRPLVFWTTDPKQAAALAKSGKRPASWHGRWLRARVEIHADEARFYIEGRLVRRWPTAGLAGSSVLLRIDGGDSIRNVFAGPLEPLGLFEPVDLSGLARAQLPRSVAAPGARVPLGLVERGRRALDLSQAGWIDEKRDPSDFYAAYDYGAPLLNDARMPMIALPKADYVAAHVLGSASQDPRTTNVLTLRIGRYGGNQQVVKRDYARSVPRRGANEFGLVEIPLTEVVAQDVLDDTLDVELTKEVHLARHVPDPNRFDTRPLGLPSGVRIAALTFEKSPLQMRVSTDESGNAFVEPQVPRLLARLSNITARAQPFVLVATARPLHGARVRASARGSVEPEEQRTVELRLPGAQRGYHDVAVELSDGSGRVLLRRKTSLALLPPDTRRHRASSPFGTWEWHGGHVTSQDSDLVGSLYKKLGFRLGMSAYPYEARKKWGVSYGFEPQLDPTLKRYEAARANNPDLPQVALMFHEHALSERHMRRVPDLFTDRPAFELNTEEEARYDSMLNDALAAAKLLRQKFPEAKISFGNGVPATKEEFYRRGLPAWAFDYGGNEAASFMRLPEAQPPDFIALNASLWMDRKLLDAYGYGDKPVHQSFETVYPGDNPGNLSSTTQADYFVRHALHSLAWGMDLIHIGMLMDVGNSYYHSNWGASGFCRAVPEVNVKPAFVAMATLTRVLDGAKFERVLDAGSPSVYALVFSRPGGQRVLAYWTVRGSRELWVKHSGRGWRLLDDQGGESAEMEPMIADETPRYLVGTGQVESATAARVAHGQEPPADAKIVASFADWKAWRKPPARSAELESYDFATPRRRGDFDFEVVPNDGEHGPSLKVAARPLTSGKDTMPMYERLALVRPVTLPGRPHEIGVWVKGNSGWGRVVFELRDAGGQRWISLGAQGGHGEPQSGWNTDDPAGQSSINFDGWRYVRFDLPGNYPWERHPWAANSNWRWDADGVVRYPLRLVGVAITLPEKVLHVAEWKAPPKSEIHLGEVLVGRRE